MVWPLLGLAVKYLSEPLLWRRMPLLTLLLLGLWPLELRMLMFKG